MFYQKLVAQHPRNPHLDVLLQYTIALLVEKGVYKSPSRPAQERMEFYLQAYLKQPMQNPEYVYHFLSGLRGFWSDAKVKRTAQDVLKRNKTIYEELAQKTAPSAAKANQDLARKGDEVMSNMLKYQERLNEF